MKCLMRADLEISFPCSRNCPLFGDCVAACSAEWNAKMKAAAVSSPVTNGDRVRDMCDGDLAKFFAKKVMDQVALISIREGLQPIRGVRLKAMKEVYARTFFSWLRSPAEEENYG